MATKKRTKSRQSKPTSKQSQESAKPKCKHKAEALVLSCIDFRFMSQIRYHLQYTLNLIDQYDHVILAGAELGPMAKIPPKPHPPWQEFFIDQLGFSCSLHCIERLVVLGHRDCGAYRELKILPTNPKPGIELKAHRDQALLLQKLVAQLQPSLHFEAYLMDPHSGPTAPPDLTRLV